MTVGCKIFVANLPRSSLRRDDDIKITIAIIPITLIYQCVLLSCALRRRNNVSKANRWKKKQSDEGIESVSLARLFLSFSPTRTPRHQQVLPNRSLARAIELTRYNYSLSRSISLEGADHAPIKLMTTQTRLFDRKVTFPGQRRVDNISETMFP